MLDRTEAHRLRRPEESTRAPRRSGSAAVRKSLRHICLPIALLATTDAHAQGLPWEVWTSPARLAELDPNDSVLERSSHCLDGCRYDRSGGAADADNIYPVRWLYRDGGEAIVFDERGPGAITRVWMTTGEGISTCIDPQVRVRFYIDGAASPALDIPLAAIFDGSTAPFTPPLVADRFHSSGGYVSYVPIAYAQSLRIALTGADDAGGHACPEGQAGSSSELLWFQFQHHRLAPGTLVTSFSARTDAPAWRNFLGHAGDDPWNAMLAPQNADSMLVPGATLALATHTGPGWLRGVRLRLSRSAYAVVSLRIVIDGEVAVFAPLADLFAMPDGASVATRSVLAGEDSAGWLYSWFPMPFGNNVAVELVADATLAQATDVASSLSFDTASVPADAGRFHAQVAHDCVPGATRLLYSQRGAGKLVGMSVRYQAGTGAAGRGFLEGDERAYVDDAVAPVWYGTGIEDYLNGGFYFDQGAYANGLSGATRVALDLPYATVGYRLMLTDSLPYAGALRLTQESGSSATDPQASCARSVAYSYRQSQPLVVGYDGFEIGNSALASAHAYIAATTAQCDVLQSRFEDDMQTARIAMACRYSAGSSHFRFRLDTDAGTPLRLRRIFDAGDGVPGSRAGSAAAEVRVNGRSAGWFSVVGANPAHRWQMQEIVLDPDSLTDALEIEVVPTFTPATPSFSESAWELRGAWKNAIFNDGFDATIPRSRMERLPR